MIIERAFTRLFTTYGRLLATNRTIFLVSLLIPCLLTCLLGTGCVLHSMRDQPPADPVRAYTPHNAPSWFEQDVLQEHWPLNPDEFSAGRNLNYKRFLCFIIRTKASCPADSDEGCNLIEGDYLPAIQRLEEHVATEISVRVNGTDFYYDKGDNANASSSCLSFWGLCSRLGKKGGPLNLLIDREFYENRSVQISYPFVHPKAGSSIYWAYNLGGVTLDSSKSVSSVQAVRFLLFFNTVDEVKMDPVALQLETKILNYVLHGDYQKTNDSKLLEVTVAHSRSVNQGLQQSTDSLVPKFTITFTLLGLFCFLNMLKLKWDANECPKLDWVKSKPWLALCGISTALLGIISGFGLMFLFGMPFDDTCAVVPFLVISIGVDDMFILVAGWHSTNHLRSLDDRMAHTLGDAAVAITITSVTSALSFAIGCLTTIVTVRLFCAFASICIVFNYLYQVTFFAACMVYFGRSELAHQNGFLCCWCKCGQTQVHDYDTDKAKEAGQHELTLTHADQNGQSNESHIPESNTQPTDLSLIQSFFRNYYGPFLLHSVTKVFVLIMFVAYLFGGFYGVWHMKQGLQFYKLLLADDPTVKQFEFSSKYMQAGVQVEIVFNNLPNMIHKQNRDKVAAIVAEFENSGVTFGVDGTMFWMREYERYRTQINGWQMYDTPEVWVQGVLTWSRQFSYYITWGLDLAWTPKYITENGTKIIQDTTQYSTCDSRTCMKAFRLRVALTAGNEANDILSTSLKFREIAAAHPQYNITTYQIFRQLADQMLVVLPNTVQNVAIAIGCMAVVALLFIPNPMCTVWIVLALLSIDLGVAGYLSLWSINLDQISMITIVMSIGFSIDFTAHIIYGYVCAPQHFTEDQKCVQSMERLAWPVFQGGISTVIGVSVLTLVDSYLVKAFFKTVFLVVLFGIAHALVFLPVLLSAVMPTLDRLYDAISTKHTKS